MQADRRVSSASPSTSPIVSVHEDRLRDSAEFLRALTESMGEGMFALDEAGRVLYINPVAVELFGFAPDALLGEVMHDRTHQPSTGRIPATQPKQCPMAGPLARPARGSSVDRDTFFRCDGTSFPVSYTCAGLRTDGGGSVVVFRDISDQISLTRSIYATKLEKLTWVGRIQDALDEDRLELYAQPIARLSDGEVTQHDCCCG